jgi:hypothetical protein
VAIIVNVYAVLVANPDTIIGDVVDDPVKLPGVLVAVYVVIVPEPIDAVNAIRIDDVDFTVATNAVGGAGNINRVVSIVD